MTHCFPTYTCQIYGQVFRTCIRASNILDFLPNLHASYLLLVHQVSVLLSASSEPLVTETLLPSRYSLPHVGRNSGLSPPAVRPAGRTNKKARIRRAGLNRKRRLNALRSRFVRDSAASDRQYGGLHGGKGFQSKRCRPRTSSHRLRRREPILQA